MSCWEIDKIFANLSGVLASIHEKSSSEPWSENYFSSILQNNKLSLGWLLSEKKENGKYCPSGFILGQEGEIFLLCVLPDRRRRGIALKLLDTFIQNVKPPITLEVSIKNSPAINLYEKRGFGVVGKRKHYYSNLDDAVIMRLEGAPI